MDFRLLGPFEVWTEAGPLPLGAPRQRAVLAALAADAGRPVPVDVLVDRVWGEAAPPAARRTLQAYLTRIRRALGSAALPRTPAGYLLDVPAGQVDVYEFRRLAATGGDPEQRLGALRAAMRLWRGEPLAGVPGEWAERTRTGWQQEYLDVAVDWATAELAGGDPTSVLTSVRALAGAHPLAEPAAAVLIRALAATGRPAEALEHYAAVRDRLLADLGTEPGPVLRAVHEAVLRGETGILAGARPVPAQLPGVVSQFAGRAAELAELDRAAGSHELLALAGTAGVGKTALAVHWAHRVAAAYPDGQLYVNLRGYDPEQPLDPADALAGFLLGLGLAEADVPAGLTDRAARLRTELAGRRLLIVLDNAASTEQVRSLLPGAPGCRTVVTSRDALAGLVALHGAYRIDLDPLPLPDATALLRRLLGPRADAEPVAVAELAERCDRLPLALRVAAELVASRPGADVARLVNELADQAGRLELLDAGGDPRAAVTAVFSWSLRHLPADQATAFALVGLHPGDFDTYAAAALAGIDHGTAGRTLAALARAHLIHPAPGGRYGMHDLLRAYAAGEAKAGSVDLIAAGTRLFDYYLGTAATAMDTLFPAEAHRRPCVKAPASAPDLTDRDAALRWLDAERATMVTIAGYAGTNYWPEHAILLSRTLFRYLASGHHLDALTLHGHARTAARELGDLAGESEATLGLGAAHLRLGRYEQAWQVGAAALSLAERAGDLTLRARAHFNLSMAAERQGRRRDRIVHAGQALDLFNATGDLVGRAAATSNVAATLHLDGRHQEAVDALDQALDLARQAGDESREAELLRMLADAHLRLGNLDRALELARQALALQEKRGHVNAIGLGHGVLADIHVMRGEPEPALVHGQRAVDLARQTGDRDAEPWGLNGLGEACIAAGQPARARTQFDAALRVATETGAPSQQGRAHAGLGDAYRDLGDPATARRHYEQALALYRDLGAPETDLVVARLAALPDA
jgi:DNA-binding SARP family transcriptional activator/tetratricopeptide (TPR) repeat protein